mmetsp:Transcript_22185/g.39940  ORF Transcript_22185/g.39940 Transcript_22185/m.39940 type:complete len:254 (-) Transcript_22185:1017-1778(-)
MHLGEVQQRLLQGGEPLGQEVRQDPFQPGWRSIEHTVWQQMDEVRNLVQRHTSARMAAIAWRRTCHLEEQPRAAIAWRPAGLPAWSRDRVTVIRGLRVGGLRQVHPTLWLDDDLLASCLRSTVPGQGVQAVTQFRVCRTCRTTCSKVDRRCMRLISTMRPSQAPWTPPEGFSKICLEWHQQHQPPTCHSQVICLSWTWQLASRRRGQVSSGYSSTSSSSRCSSETPSLRSPCAGSSVSQLLSRSSAVDLKRQQ